MSEATRVLIVSYEAAPFFKTGGLGDVMGSLPKALVGLGVDARLVIPYYQQVREKYPKFNRIGEFRIYFGAKEEEIGVYEDTCVPHVYFLSNRANLSHVNTRGRNKRIEQFAFFSLAVSHFLLWLSKNRGWKSDIMHCNDWHTALVPLILQKLNLSTKTLLSIHNLEYQGFGSIKVVDFLNLKNEDIKEIKRENPVKAIDMLGEGILHADVVSTVSPNYAAEIMASEENHHRIIYSYLRRREKEGLADGKIIGILNGIDYEVWNPSKDKLLFQAYSNLDWKEGKKKNKEELLQSLNLPIDRPTFCFVGRMAAQKGVELLIRIIPRMAALNVNVIFLGQGDPNIEKSVKRIVGKYPQFAAASLSYNEEVGHRFYAASDFIVIPSHFEPCGLIQMIAMRYGTLPIASKTGGLKDSIKNGRNGFLFQKNSSRALLKTIKKALSIYHDVNKFNSMVENAMKTDFSWDKSAVLYKKLYQKMI